jgi:hypothetical protein
MFSSQNKGEHVTKYTNPAQFCSLHLKLVTAWKTSLSLRVASEISTVIPYLLTLASASSMHGT